MCHSVRLFWCWSCFCAFFRPDSFPHSTHGWRERWWPGWEQQLPPWNRWPGGKFLTRPQTVGLSMQEQSASNSFRDTWISKHSHTHGLNVPSDPSEQPKPPATLSVFSIPPKKLNASYICKGISGLQTYSTSTVPGLCIAVVTAAYIFPNPEFVGN